jgi:hypothetical protein
LSAHKKVLRGRGGGRGGGSEGHGAGGRAPMTRSKRLAGKFRSVMSAHMKRRPRSDGGHVRRHCAPRRGASEGGGRGEGQGLRACFRNARSGEPLAARECTLAMAGEEKSRPTTSQKPRSDSSMQRAESPQPCPAGQVQRVGKEVRVGGRGAGPTRGAAELGDSPVQGPVDAILERVHQEEWTRSGAATRTWSGSGTQWRCIARRPARRCPPPPPWGGGRSVERAPHGQGVDHSKGSSPCFRWNLSQYSLVWNAVPILATSGYASVPGITEVAHKPLSGRTQKSKASTGYRRRCDARARRPVMIASFGTALPGGCHPSLCWDPF